jgi:MoxR-like ATPase
MIEWHIKSTTKAQQGLYEYDAVSRLRDSQLGDERVHDVRNYIRKGKLWQAFEADGKVVLLIDEIDKADIEFPNDLLQELDRMEFHVYETGETIRAQRPIVIITSNNEKELPDAFLRRCFFHYIRFPTWRRCADRRGASPGHQGELLTTALTQFYEMRETPGLKKKPSTSEVLDWLKLLLAEDLTPRICARRRPTPCPAARRAAEERTGRALFERLAFMARQMRFAIRSAIASSSRPRCAASLYAVGDGTQRISIIDTYSIGVVFSTAARATCASVASRVAKSCKINWLKDVPCPTITRNC